MTALIERWVSNWASLGMTLEEAADFAGVCEMLANDSPDRSSDDIRAEASARCAREVQS